MADAKSHSSTESMDPGQVKKLLGDAKSLRLPQRFAVEQRVAKALGISFTADQLFSMSSPTTAVTRLEPETYGGVPSTHLHSFGGIDLSARNASIDAVIDISTVTPEAERAIVESQIATLAQHKAGGLSGDALAELVVALQASLARPGFHRRHPEVAVHAAGEISRAVFATPSIVDGQAAAGGTKANSDR